MPGGGGRYMESVAATPDAQAAAARAAYGNSPFKASYDQVEELRKQYTSGGGRNRDFNSVGFDNAVAALNANAMQAYLNSEPIKNLLGSGSVTTQYGQIDGRNGMRDDRSNITGFVRDNHDGTFTQFDVAGKQGATYRPSSGGGLFGGIGDFISGLGSAASDIVSGVSKAVAENPIGQAAITAIAAANGIDPATTAAILGVNQTSQHGDVGAGLTTGLVSYGLGNAVNALSPATTTAATAAPESAEPFITGGTHIADSAGVFPAEATTSLSDVLPKSVVSGIEKGVGSAIGKTIGLPVDTLTKLANGDFSGLVDSAITGTTAKTVSDIITGGPKSSPTGPTGPTGTVPTGTTTAPATPPAPTNDAYRQFMMMQMMQQPEQQAQPVQTPLVDIKSTVNPFGTLDNPFSRHPVHASSGGSIEDLIHLLRR